jgi:hypothetical protein
MARSGSNLAGLVATMRCRSSRMPMDSKQRNAALGALALGAALFAVKGAGPSLAAALPFVLAALGVALTAGTIMAVAGTLLAASERWSRAALTAVGATLVFVVYHFVP